MSATFEGDAGALERLAARLEEVEALLPDLYEALAEEGRTLVVEQFDRQGDAYGNAWAPRDPRFGRGAGGQILRNTGRFQNSFVSMATSDGFEVGSNFIGARVLTQGAVIRAVRAPRLRIPLAGGGFAFPEEVRIPARGVIPTGAAGPIWEPRLREVVEDFAAELLEVA